MSCSKNMKWAQLVVGWASLSVGCGGHRQELPPSAKTLVEARQAIAAGDSATALHLLNQSIEHEPNVWALVERAKIYLVNGDDESAKSDCKTILELHPANRDVQWMLDEMKKPVERRFQGKNSRPPSYVK